MQRLTNLLKAAGVVKQGNFTFNSGIKSKHKVDLNYAICSFEILDLITEKLTPHTDGVDIIIGQRANGDNIAQELARVTGKEFAIYDKKKRKIYGGPIEGKVLLGIDDVCSTGLSQIYMVDDVRQQGGSINKVCSIAFWNLPQPSGKTPAQLFAVRKVEHIPLIYCQALLE